MWRIGFYVWRAVLWTKIVAPAALILIVIYAASGASVLFWSALVVAGVFGLGAGYAISDFRAREFGPVPGRERVR